ncbi:MAG: glycine cleavage system aminomethyltransferase GcvT [Planctomycetota bacterium]
MNRTPFYKYHQKHDAKFVDFAGWEMPLHYGSIIDEHTRCRTAGAVFDVSHMGRIKVAGRHARRFVETVCTRKLSDMDERQARYTLVCNERGGVMDDILVYRFADHWLLVVNASNRAKLLEHFNQVIADQSLRLKLTDQTESTAMIAVQGPRVMEHIGAFSKEVPTLGNYRFTTKNLMILKMIVSRTGYTGEDGVEVILNSNMAGTAIKLLLKDPDPDDPNAILPAGLGARDTLRIEAGMPLYGHELDEDTDPFSAGLAFGVSLHKHETPEDAPPIPRFIGQDALEAIAAADAPPKTRIGLTLDGKRTPRQHAAVLSADHQAIGEITSACLSPTLGHPIAMAYVDSASTPQPGDAVKIQLPNSSTLDATACTLPFYKRP